MFKNEDDFKKIVSRLNNIDNKPNPAHRENLRRQMLSAFNETNQRTLAGQTLIRTIIKSRITKLATAAIIIITIGFFAVHRSPPEQTRDHTPTEVATSPAKMLTLGSTTMAYRRGGMDAVEKQIEKAFTMLGPRTTSIPLEDLL